MRFFNISLDSFSIFLYQNINFCEVNTVNINDILILSKPIKFNHFKWNFWREFTGVETSINQKVSFKDVLLDLFLTFFSVSKC